MNRIKVYLFVCGCFLVVFGRLLVVYGHLWQFVFVCWLFEAVCGNLRLFAGGFWSFLVVCGLLLVVCDRLECFVGVACFSKYVSIPFNYLSINYDTENPRRESSKQHQPSSLFMSWPVRAICEYVGSTNILLFEFVFFIIQTSSFDFLDQNVFTWQNTTSNNIFAIHY